MQGAIPPVPTHLHVIFETHALYLHITLFSDMVVQQMRLNSHINENAVYLKFMRLLMIAGVIITTDSIPPFWLIKTQSSNPCILILY